MAASRHFLALMTLFALACAFPALARSAQGEPPAPGTSDDAPSATAEDEAGATGETHGSEPGDAEDDNALYDEPAPLEEPAPVDEPAPDGLEPPMPPLDAGTADERDPTPSADGGAGPPSEAASTAPTPRDPAAHDEDDPGAGATPKGEGERAAPKDPAKPEGEEDLGGHQDRPHGPTTGERVQETLDAVVEAARPKQTRHAFDVGLTLSAGAGACHLLIAPCGAGTGTAVGVPYVSFGPGIGVSGQYAYKLGESWRLSFSGDFSIGGFKEGSLLGQLGSYNARAGLTFVWFDKAAGFTLTSEPHFGFSSISLVPVPLVGVTNALTFDALFWLDQDWVVWEINAALTTDLLVIAPYPSVAVSNLVMGRLFGVYLGVEAQAGAEAKVALLANSVGGSIGLRFVAGYAF